MLAGRAKFGTPPPAWHALTESGCQQRAGPLRQAVVISDSSAGLASAACRGSTLTP